MSDGTTRPWVATVPTRIGQTAFPEKSELHRPGSWSTKDACNLGSLRRFVRRFRKKEDKVVLPDSHLQHKKQKLDLVVRIQPTPSLVDAMDCDPLMMPYSETPKDPDHDQDKLGLLVNCKERPSKTKLVKVLNNFLSRRKTSKEMPHFSDEDGRRIMAWLNAHHDADTTLHSAKSENESGMSPCLRHCSYASTLISEESPLGYEVGRPYASYGPRYGDPTCHEMENNFIAELMDTSPRVELPDTSSPAWARSDVSEATPSLWTGSTLGTRSEISSFAMSNPSGFLTLGQNCNSMDITNASKVYNTKCPTREVLASNENHSTRDGSPAIESSSAGHNVKAAMPKSPPIIEERRQTAENKAITAPSVVSVGNMLAEEGDSLITVGLICDHATGPERPRMLSSDALMQELGPVKAATERLDRHKGKSSERDLNRIDTKSCADNAIVEGEKLRCSLSPCSYATGNDVLPCMTPVDASDSNRGPPFRGVRVSSEGSSETNSIWLSEYSDDAPKLRDNCSFLELKESALQRLLESFGTCTCHRCHAVDGNRTHDGSQTSMSLSNNSDGSGSSKKQAGKSSATGAGLGDGKAPSEPRPSGPPTKRRRTDERKISFACPYSKKDPMRHRDCYKYTLTRVRDVKQHLTRCHRRPLYCPRCFAIFETEDSRDEHNLACNIASPSTTRPDGITEAQRQQLSKKSIPNSPFEDQWFAIWKILFPDSPPPKSPYVDNDLLQDITRYQDFVTTSGPNILSEVLSQRGAMITWSMPNEERDLAALQQAILEEGLRAVFEQWANNNGIARAASTATSSGSSSARTGVSTPPTSASVSSTNVALPPRGHSTLRYVDPMTLGDSVPPEIHTSTPSQRPEIHCPATAQSAHSQGQQFVPNTTQPISTKAPRRETSQNARGGPSTRRRTIEPGIDYSLLGQQFSDDFLQNSRTHQGESALLSMATEAEQGPQMDIAHSILNEGPLASFDYEPGIAPVPFEDDGDNLMGVPIVGSVAPGLPELDFGTGLGQIDHDMGSWIDTV